MKIAFYISGHRFGHATRMAALAKQFIGWGIRCYINSNRPSFLFNDLKKEHTIFRNKTIDFGIIDKDIYYPDIEKTSQKLFELFENKDEIIRTEVDFLKAENINLVIADIPFFAFEAASLANIPSVAISNFDWHWVYSKMLPKTIQIKPIIEEIKKMYKKATYALKLPFSSNESMASFDTIFDAGIVAKKAETTKQQVCLDFNLDSSKPLVLLSFSTVNKFPFDASRLLNIEGINFLSRIKDENFSNLHYIDESYDYSKLLAACDVVITKVGYSTLAEATQAGTFVIYSSVGLFCEEELLKNGMERYQNSMYIPYNYINKINFKKTFEEILPYSRTSNYINANLNTANFIVKKHFELLNDKFAIIDVGTNNVQLMWADGQKILHRAVEISALGKNMQNGLLQEKAIEKLKSILQNYIDISYKFCDRIVVFATSASREAKNINIVADWLDSKYGIKYNILTEEEEAKLNGIANLHDFKSENLQVFFDIGGGSTEITCVENGKIINVSSLKMGLRRIINACGHDVAKQKGFIKNALNGLKFAKNTEFIGIGGTVCSLVALKQDLKHYDSEKVHGAKVCIDDINSIEEKYIKGSVGIPFDFISKNAFACGINTVKTFIKFFNINSFKVSDKGLQHGFLYLDYLQKIKYL